MISYDIMIITVGYDLRLPTKNSESEMSKYCMACLRGPEVLQGLSSRFPMGGALGQSVYQGSTDGGHPRWSSG